MILIWMRFERIATKRQKKNEKYKPEIYYVCNIKFIN